MMSEDDKDTNVRQRNKGINDRDGEKKKEEGVGMEKQQKILLLMGMPWVNTTGKAETANKSCAR